MLVLHLIASDEVIVCVCMCEPYCNTKQEKLKNQAMPLKWIYYKKKRNKIEASSFKASAQITIERTNVYLTCVRSSNINQM